LNSPGEPQEKFVKRINAAARLEEEGKSPTIGWWREISAREMG